MQVGKARAHYQGLTSFWAGIMTEALSTMLDSAQSGRLEVERRNKEDVLIRILPTLSTGLSLKKSPELVIACYMLCVVLANKGSLSDDAVDSLMEAVAGSWTRDTIASGITCLAVVFQHKEQLWLPKPVIKSILRLEDVADVFAGLSSNSIVRLLSGLMNVLMENDNEEVAANCVSLVGQVLQSDIMGAEDKTQTIIALLKTIDESHRKGYMSEEVRQLSSDTLAAFVESKELDIVLQRAISESNVDIKALEITLQLAIDTTWNPRKQKTLKWRTYLKTALKMRILQPQLHVFPNDEVNNQKTSLSSFLHLYLANWLFVSLKQQHPRTSWVNSSVYQSFAEIPDSST